MSETGDAGLTKPRLVFVVLHASQLTLAVVILGLVAYGVRCSVCNVLVYTLVVALCTILACAYLILSHTYFKNIYNPYVATAYHLLMLIFWIVDLGLLAHLANLWRSLECIYEHGNGLVCVPYEKHNVTTLCGTFYIALVTGAVLAAFELSFWVLTATMIYMYAWKEEAVISNVGPTDRDNEHNNNGTDSTSSMEEIRLTDILREECDTIFTTPPPAIAPFWEYPRAQENRPGPRPLIDDDDHRFSKDSLRVLRRSPMELYSHSPPHAVFAQEVQDRPGTPTPPPIGPEKSGQE